MLWKSFSHQDCAFNRRLILVVLLTLIAGQLFWVYVDTRKEGRGGNVHRGNTSRLTTTLTQSYTPRPVRTEIPILLWWDSVYNSVDEIKTCGTRQCRISNNHSLKDHPDTKGFIFYGSHFKPYNLPLRRKEDHRWALIHEESPRNAYILSHGSTLSYFNYTATYNQKASYPITTQWLKCPDWIHDAKYVLPLVDKNRLRRAGLAPILYIHSDCGVPSDRDKYVELLQQYIDVDSYGSCENNKELPKRLRFRNDMTPMIDTEFYHFVARYKFTMAFENYVCEDYITEKFWRPIQVGSVPIVFGAPNIKDYLPSNMSAIHIGDFQDVEDVARYINLLDNNDRLYLEYLDYKTEPVQNHNLLKHLHKRDWEPEFCSKNRANGRIKTTIEQLKIKRIYDSIFYGFECFLCNEIIDSLKDRKEDLRSNKGRSLGQYTCPSPRKFDEDGHYSVHDKTWAAEWMYGKYEAIVMETLINENTICSEAKYHKLVKSAMKDDHGLY